MTQAVTNRLRVFNLGLPKSGTTTLGMALGKAGLKVADWRFRKGQTDDRRLLYGFVGDKLYQGYYETGDPLHLMAEFDAVTEASVASKGMSLWPQTDWGLIEALRRHHPGIKFLLSHRDPGDLARSMMGWSNLGRSRLPNQNVPGMPAGYGTGAGQLERWIEGHYAFCRRVFRDDPDFLEYDILDPEAPRAISAFLGLELPWWGRANVKSSQEEAERQVYLHAGAACAGTEALHLCLAGNRAELEARGTAAAYTARDGAPEGRLRLKLPEPRHKGSARDEVITRAGREIAGQFGAAERLILSESNVPGRLQPLLSGQFFTGAEQRAHALARALGQPPAHLVFVVRSYGPFFTAVYRKLASQRGVEPFEVVRPLLLTMERGWAEVVAALQEGLQPEEMTVIDYAGPQQVGDILDALLPEGEAEGLERGPVAAGLGDTAEDGPIPGAAGFGAEELRMLEARYAADLDRIDGMSGVRLIRAG